MINLIYKSLIAVLLFTSPNANAQAINKDSIDAICKKIIDPNGPAVAVLIMKDGKVAYKKTFGYENIEAKRKASNTTQFNIASVSKSFTAAAIMQLVERRKLSLTDTTGKYLKDFVNGGKINIHHLLSHTSGLSDSSTLSKSSAYAGVNFVPFREALEKREIDFLRLLYMAYVLNGYDAKYPPPVDFKMKDTFLLFTPGTKYTYSNTGYTMLASIVSNVAGMPFKDYMRKNIFLPVGMKNTYSYNSRNDADIQHPAHTYYLMKDGSYRKMFERVPDFEGATNIYTTIDDWVKYENLLAGKAPSVLSKESLNKMFTPHVTSNMRPKIKWMYGYGWMIVDRYSEKDTMRCIQHSGGTLGTAAWRVRYVDQNVTLTVFYAHMEEDMTKYKRFDLSNAIEGYFKRNNILAVL